MTRSVAVGRAPEPAAPAGWLRELLAVLSPEGARARLSILIFHRVHAERDSLFPEEMHAASFRERMFWIRHWFNVLPLEDAVAALRRGTLPARALAITFDDGYGDNATVALPILRELGLHATFFVATEYLDGGRMWNDTVIETLRRASGDEFDATDLGLGTYPIRSLDERRAAIDAIIGQLKYLPTQPRQQRAEAMAARACAALPGQPMMTPAQLRSLAAAGMGFGGHTVTHPILARLDDAAARREIAEGRETLEAMIGQPVRLFAYPNGKPRIDYTAAHVRMARELGFIAAVSTAPGAARTGGSAYELPRFMPWGRTQVRWVARVVQNLFTSVEAASP